jgi:type IV pilus assembly protein PilM
MAGGSFIGLDIGSNLIKVAEVRRGGAGYEVTAIGLAPTPQEAFDNSIIVDAQLLGQAVKNLLRQTGVSTKQVVSSVSGQSAVVVRVIEVPKMNEAELAETMKWEVERQVPFSASEVIMDYKPIERPEGGDGQNMEVVMAVAQQDMIDHHVEMLFAAGLKPVAIDVEPLAAARSLLELAGNGTHPPGYAVAIVNLGASNTDIGIFRDNLLAFPRTLPLAGDHLTRAIADALHVDLATAENYKREMGEILLDQVAQPAAPSFGGGDDLGFVDFSAPPPPPATGTTTPSGRMPFDFSTPGETPPAVPSGSQAFDLTGQPAPAPAVSPFDVAETSAPHAGLTPPPSTLDAPAFPPAPAPTFPEASPAYPPAVPASNLPVPASTGDPARDALRIQIFNAIAPVLAELVQELRRSLDYYRSRAGDAPLHEMLLVGGTAKLKNLGPFLEAELGIPTRVANPLQRLQVTSKNYSQAHLEEIASLFPVSVGLGAYKFVADAAGGRKRR